LGQRALPGQHGGGADGGRAGEELAATERTQIDTDGNSSHGDLLPGRSYRERDYEVYVSQL
jgi:hypothetical protein